MAQEAYELAQKLIDLKWWQEQFDRAIEMMDAAHTEEEALTQWRLSHEAEDNYQAASDWLTAHGYIAIWNEAEQCYQVRR